jgi:DNA-binding response OmpR family regulator
LDGFRTLKEIVPITSSHRPGVTPSGKQILLVDDDREVREMLATGLRLRGYAALQADNATDALRLAADPRRLSLLVTDFEMPMIDGLELIHRFRALRPGIPVLLISGSVHYPTDAVHDPEIPLLHKPFELSEFLARVRLLAGPPDAGEKSGR